WRARTARVGSAHSHRGNLVLALCVNPAPAAYAVRISFGTVRIEHDGETRKWLTVKRYRSGHWNQLKAWTTARQAKDRCGTEDLGDRAIPGSRDLCHHEAPFGALSVRLSPIRSGNVSVVGNAAVDPGRLRNRRGKRPNTSVSQPSNHDFVRGDSSFNVA